MQLYGFEVDLIWISKTNQCCFVLSFKFSFLFSFLNKFTSPLRFSVPEKTSSFWKFELQTSIVKLSFFFLFLYLFSSFFLPLSFFQTFYLICSISPFVCRSHSLLWCIFVSHYFPPFPSILTSYSSSFFQSFFLFLLNFNLDVSPFFMFFCLFRFKSFQVDFLLSS